MTVLLAGVGNVFRGDDGFGCEVLRRLAGRRLPAGVAARDFGTSAIDLRFWMERHEAVVVIDVVARGRAPGTLCVLDPEASRDGDTPGDLAPHGLTATSVIAWAAARRGRGELPRVLRVIGCEPATFGDEDEGALGLSPAVEAALAGAVDLALEVAATLAAKSDEREEGPSCTSSG